jgi:hypothetical protein
VASSIYEPPDVAAAEDELELEGALAAAAGGLAELEPEPDPDPVFALELDDELAGLATPGCVAAGVELLRVAVPAWVDWVVGVAWAFDWPATAIVTAPVSPAAPMAIPRLVRRIRFSPRSRRVRGVRVMSRRIGAPPQSSLRIV